MPVIKSHLLRNKARLISAGVKDKGDAHANKTCSIRCSCSATTELRVKASGL